MHSQRVRRVSIETDWVSIGVVGMLFQAVEQVGICKDACIMPSSFCKQKLEIKHVFGTPDRRKGDCHNYFISTKEANVSCII